MSEWYLWDPGAREREKQDKILKRQKEYAEFAEPFLRQTQDICEGWPITTIGEMVRCGRVDCNQAIDDGGSIPAIRRHLYQSHRAEIGVTESGIIGENQALDSGSSRDPGSGGGSSGD